MADVIQSVDRAIQLLREVASSPGLSLTALASRVGLLPTTAGRLLTTLERHRLVERDPTTREYRLGLGILDLNSQLQAQLALRPRLEPLARALATTVRENVTLAILDGGSVLHLLDVDGAADQELVVRSQEGRRNTNLNATAAGKLLLAFAPEAQREQAIAGLDFARTASRTLTEPAALRAHLDDVRRQGYALSVDENTPLIRGMAAPVCDHAGTVVAALAIHGPTVRFTEERLPGLLASLRAAARQASASLGYVA